MRSLFFLTLLFLLLEVYLMDLDHRFLVLLVVVWGDRTGRSYQLDYLLKFSHLGPLGCIESVGVPQIDICSLSQQQFDYFLEPESSSVMERGQPSLVTQSSVRTIVEKQSSKFIVVFLY
jgi:hypothetical protein